MLMYNRRGRATGEKIAMALQLPDEVLIRWGSSLNPEVDEDYERVINSSEAIQNATDKLLSASISATDLPN